MPSCGPPCQLGPVCTPCAKNGQTAALMDFKGGLKKLSRFSLHRKFCRAQRFYAQRMELLGNIAQKKIAERRSDQCDPHWNAVRGGSVWNCYRA